MINDNNQSCSKKIYIRKMCIYNYIRKVIPIAIQAFVADNLQLGIVQARFDISIALIQNSLTESVSSFLWMDKGSRCNCLQNRKTADFYLQKTADCLKLIN